MATMKVLGAAEVEKLLRQLPERLAKNVTINSLRAGGRVIAAGMKSRVPVRTGALRNSITVSSAKKATKGRSNVVVGFKKPVSRRAHLTEFGTEHSRAEPFIRPTIDQDGEEAIKVIGEALGKGVEREAAALAGGKKSFVTGRKI
jgi:HK97 gp10 family phage protein